MSCKHDLYENSAFHRARGLAMTTSAALMVLILCGQTVHGQGLGGLLGGGGGGGLGGALDDLGSEMGGPAGDAVSDVGEAVQDVGDALNAADNRGNGGLGDGLGQIGGGLLGDQVGGLLNGVGDGVGDILNGGYQGGTTGGPGPSPETDGDPVDDGPLAFDPLQRRSNGMACSSGGNSTGLNGFTVVGADGQALGVVHDAIVARGNQVSGVRFRSNGIGTGGRSSCVQVSGGGIMAQDGFVVVPILPTR